MSRGQRDPKLMMLASVLAFAAGMFLMLLPWPAEPSFHVVGVLWLIAGELWLLASRRRLTDR